MKIGIFDPYLDTLGGGEKYMLTLASYLSEKNKVSLFWDETDAMDIKQKTKKRFGIDIENIKFVKNIFSSKVPLVERIREVSKYHAIIYLSDGSIPITATKNLILHFQFPVEWVSNSFKTKLKLMQVKQVICNSYFTKMYIDRKFGVESIVVYPPVDIYKFNNKNKENIILHVGRFGIDAEGKNFKKQDVMIDVFKKMTDASLVGWRFVLIISVHPRDQEWIKDLKKKAIGYPIEIIENPDKSILTQVYERAKIYWHASGFGENLEKHPEKAEHFGIATAEAMSAGAVPVVINAGGQPEIVQDGKNGFLWNTTEELMQKTKKLIKNNKLREEMSKEASQSAKMFSKERFCKEIEKVIV